MMSKERSRATKEAARFIVVVGAAVVSTSAFPRTPAPPRRPRLLAASPFGRPLAWLPPFAKSNVVANRSGQPPAARSGARLVVINAGHLLLLDAAGNVVFQRSAS